MFIKNKFPATGFLSLIIFLSCSLYAQNINLKIIETSDIHGALLPYDLLNDTATSSSLAQIHSYVLREKYMHGQEIILLDNGDILQGDPLVYFTNYIDTSKKNVFADAMNFMGYDAATIGNHDIETGHGVYDKFREQINFPWLAANAVNKETGEPYFQPYTIIERKGMKIAVLGLITPAVPSWLPEILWKGIVFEDMVESAEKWVEIIKEKENPDLLIGLFHSGINYNYNNETEDTYRNENASELVAKNVPGFDVLFVGHDHAVWNYKIENSAGDSVLIVGPHSRARTVAVANIEMEFDSVKNLWNKKNISGEIVEIKNYRPDDHFMSKFMIYLNVVGNYVEKPVGQIRKTVSSQESIFGPSAFIDLIHTAQLELTGADISFSEPLSFNSRIDSGWIYVADFFKLYHYENFLYTMSLSGQEINDYLEYSYANWFNQMKDENDHLIKFATDESGEIKFSERYGTPETEERFYNYSSAAGIIYTVDVSMPADDRVNIISLSDGTPFNVDSVYTVAMNSYRGNGGGGHLTRGARIPKEELSKRVISSTGKDFRYILMGWAEEKKILSPKLIGNWKVIPEDWWKKGKVQDYKLIFGGYPDEKNREEESY